MTSEWIEHDGKGMPVDGDEVPDVRFADGVEDGNVPSKSGRDDLFNAGLIDRSDGWQWLTRDGIMLALGMGLDREKEKRQRQRRIPR